MRGLKLLSVALLTVALGRGVRLLPSSSGEMPSRFDPNQSAALFVGVREFPNSPGLGEVRYPVDDAINLAWVFALEPRVRLVAPERVVLALAGEPHKPESRKQLTELRSAGARIEQATRQHIETLLEQQAKNAASGGIFVVGFATHGFSIDGASYVLASSSTYEDAETSIPVARILDVAARAPRSLLFFDACRTPRGTRTASLPPPFRDALTTAAGQVVFTTSGKVAVERSDLRNGAFTAAVVAGLQCKAKRDQRGYVTVATLADYVERRLKTWLIKNYDPNTRTAVKVTSDGDNDEMPLATCGSPTPLFRKPPERVAWDDRSITAYDGRGMELWHSRTNGRVAHAEVADLDDDRAKEVIATIDGKLAVLRPDGELWWTGDTDAPPNYDDAGPLKLSKFIIGDLYAGNRQQIVALSDAVSSSRLSIFDDTGRIIGSLFHPDRLQHVAIGAPTSHHEPKIVVAGRNRNLCGDCSTVFLLDPDKIEGEAPPYTGKLRFGTQVWYGYIRTPSIHRLEIVDRNDDRKRDISLITPNGRISLDFEGRTIESTTNTSFILVK